MNGLQDLINKLQQIEEAAPTTQAQYDNDKQILTYNGKQYTWNPQAQVSGQGTVVSAPSMAVGSRNMGSTNVELNTDGTYTKTDRAPTAPATTAPATTTSPPATSNPYANDPKQSAIYTAMSPEDQAWATKGGGKPDLTDPYIAARAPNKFKPVATPAPTAPAAVTPPAVTPPAVTPPANDQKQDDGKAAKVKRFTELLVKAGVMTAPTATTVPDPQLGNYSLAPASVSGPGIKLPPATPVKESIVFKSKIGQLLVESGALDSITEAPGEMAQMGMPTDIASSKKKVTPTAAPALSKEEYSELSKLYGDLSVTYKDDAELAPLFTAYNKVPPTWSQAPAPAPNKPAFTPMKPEPNIQGIQNLFNSLGITDNAGNKLKPDGVWGWRSEEAKWNFKKKFPAGSPEFNKEQDFASKIAPEFQWRIIPDKTGQTQRIGPSSTKDMTALAPAATAQPPANSQKVAPVNSSQPQAVDTPAIKQITDSIAQLKQQAANPATTPEMKASSLTAIKQLETMLTAERAKARPVAESGFANDELNRLVSLVHHR